MKRILIEKKGDPLVIVMQLEELTKLLQELILKVDETREILRRIEDRQKRTTWTGASPGIGGE